MNIPTYMLDKIIIGLIAITLLYIFYPKDDGENKKEVIIDEMAYEDFPLIAWFDTEEKWDGSEQPIVKIKYRVFDHNSRIWVYNANGYVVHKQPYDRDPKDDGTPRDFTYSWRLYKSEWSDAIQSGDYTIKMGYEDPDTGDNQRRITITI